MHQQEVVLVGLLTYGLADTCCHRHSADTCRTNQRVNLLLQEQVHNLGHDDARSRTDTECNNTYTQNTNRLPVHERSGSCCSTNGKTQTDNNDVVQLVLSSLRQAFYYSAFLHQITQHQTADKRTGRGHYQRYDNGHNDGEQNLLLFRYGAQLLHANHALVLSS